MIQAGCNRNELVFYPFMESRTIAILALRLSRLALGFELPQTELRIFYDKSKLSHPNHLDSQTGNICKSDNFRS